MYIIVIPFAVERQEKARALGRHFLCFASDVADRRRVAACLRSAPLSYHAIGLTVCQPVALECQELYLATTTGHPALGPEGERERLRR